MSLNIKNNFLDELISSSESLFNEGFIKNPHIEQKKDFSLVSVFDKKIENNICSKILDNFPDHNIVAEESGTKSGSSEYTWFIDPIDGTRSYLCGNPLCGILIGCYKNDKPVIGISLLPALGFKYICIYGKAGHLNNRILKSSSESNMQNSILASTSPNQYSPSGRQKFDRLADKVLAVNWGGDLFNYMMIAEGKINIVMEENLKIMDIMALIPILETSGAEITDWQGNSIHPENGWDGTVLAAGNKNLLDEGLRIINEV